MKSSSTICAILFSLLFVNAHCDVYGAVPSEEKVEQQLQPTTMPSMVYVSDFALDVSEIKDDGGLLGQRGLLRGELLGRRGPLRSAEDPAATGANLVNLLAQSITQALNDRSIQAVRLPQGESPPNNGWIVRGQFLEVNEGNRLQRAVIGFGAGESDMQIQVDVCNLFSHPNTPFLTFGAESESGRKPGAIVTMNPYVAAAKFVLSKNAPEKDIQHVGAQIAAEIINYMRTRGLIKAK